MADDILLEARGDASQLTSEFREAQESVESSLEEMASAAEAVDFSDAFEAGDLTDGIEGAVDTASEALDQLGESAEQYAEAAEDAASASEDLGDKNRGAADDLQDFSSKVKAGGESLGELSSKTKAAADAGSEGASRISDAWEAVENALQDAASGVNAADQAFEKLGGSPAEFISDAADETQQLVILLADASKNIRQLDEESREGLSGFADRSAKAKQRLGELNDIIEKQGDAAIPGLRKELQRLEDQYEKTFSEGANRAARLEAEIEQQEDGLKRLKLDAQGAQGGMVDLTEAIRLRFPAASKAIGGGVAALAAFKVAFESTREFASFLNENFGVDVDKLATRWLRLDEVAQRFVGSGDDLVNTFLRVGNQLNTLGGAGANVESLQREFDALAQSVRSSDGEIKVQGDDIERLQGLVRRTAEEWKAYAASQKEAGLEANDAKLAVQALAEEVEGVKADELAADFEHLVDAARGLGDTARSVENQPLFEAWRDRAADLREILSTMPDELRGMFQAATGQDADAAVSELDRMAESIGEVITQTKEAREAAEEHAKAQADAARTAGEAWRQVETQLQQLAQAGRDALPEAPDTISPEVDVAGAKNRLAELEDRLADIRNKPIVSLDEVNLESSLISQIGEARNELANLQVQVPLELDTSNLGTQAADALNDALASSNFEDAFRGLDTAAQQQVASLISEFDGLLRASQNLDPAIIQDYGRAIQQALGTEGATAAASLGESFGTLGQNSADTISRLLEIAQTGSSANASLTVLDQTVRQVHGSAGEGTITLSKTGETLAQIGEQGKTGAAGLSEAGISLQQLAQDAGAAADAADCTRLRIEGTGEAIEITRKQAEDGATGLERLGTGAAQAEPSLTATADAGQRAGEGLGQAAQGASDLTTNLEPIAGHTAGETLLQLAEISTNTAAPLATLASNAGDAGTQLSTVADASERIVAAEDVPEALNLTAEAAVAAAPGVGQLAEQATAVASATETVLEKGQELPDILGEWGSAAEGLAGQLQPLNEGALGEHRMVVADTATAYRDTVTAQDELGSQIGTLVGQLEILQEQLTTTNTRLDEGIEKHREYDRSLEETEGNLEDFGVTIDETHKALAALVDEEVLGGLVQLNSLLNDTVSALGSVEQKARDAATALAEVTQ